jgi:hypothetical protein
MSDTIADLERQKAEILRQICALGDFRTGSITSVRGRCGKPTCHCYRPNDPGHGPHYRLTRKVNGKTVSESFPTTAALRKAQREVAEFHKFRKLSQDLIEVSERLCRLRAVESVFFTRETANAG